MEKIRDITQGAFEDVITDMNASYACYREMSDQPPAKLPWAPKVRFLGQVYEEAVKDGGAEFETAYNTAYQKVKMGIASKKLSLVQGAIDLVEVTLKYVKDQSPMAVLALAPPYYPSVNNSMLGGAAHKADAAIRNLVSFADTELGQPYTVFNYFSGICDLSYAMYKADPSGIEYIQNNMLLWGDVYSIPLDMIQKLSMPMVNIGPWGKGLHKYTERVNKRDLLEHTPKMVHFMVGQMLGF